MYLTRATLHCKYFHTFPSFRIDICNLNNFRLCYSTFIPEIPGSWDLINSCGAYLSRINLGQVEDRLPPRHSSPKHNTVTSC